jgi:predicted TPR repeat methyltransferase
LHLLALLKFVTSRPEEAERLLRRVVQLEPRHASAHNNLGNVCRLQGRLEEAMEWYLQALVCDPTLADAHNNLGVCYRQRGRLPEALGALERSLELSPDLLDARYNLANVLAELGRGEEAIGLLREVLEKSHYYMEAYKSLGFLFLALGRNEEAAAVARQWLERAPESPTATHLLARAEGRAEPTRASDAFVRHLFDGAAEYFDEHLRALDYQAPQHVCGALAERRAQVQGLDILDAGCGTGLCGPLLRPFARCLVGVDLSPGMLAKAHGRGYDRLCAEELTAFLAGQAEQYDVIVSADTLVYFGRLDAAFRGAASALRPGGLLVFTVERSAGEDAEPGYRCTMQGRYRHSERYLRSELAAAGMAIEELRTVSLRMNHGDPVSGFLVVARRERNVR